jgi:peptidoglycan/LPS O-acetylase OafA/YrhL
MVNIQALRAVAAWAVVGHHLVDALRNYIAIGRFPYNPAIGSYGVEVFFVISGFVMMASTSKRAITPGRFLAERWVRVAPLYWALTLGVAGAMWAGLRLFAAHGFDPARLVTSLAFMPSWVDGRIGNPVLFPGWTLNYEMMFYALFAVALLFPWWCSAAFVVSALGFAVVAQWMLSDPLVDYLGRDIVLGFAGDWPVVRASARGDPVRAGWPLIAMAVVAMIMLDLTDFGKSVHGEIAVTAAAIMMVAGRWRWNGAGWPRMKGWPWRRAMPAIRSIWSTPCASGGGQAVSGAPPQPDLGGHRGGHGGDGDRRGCGRHVGPPLVRGAGDAMLKRALSRDRVCATGFAGLARFLGMDDARRAISTCACKRYDITRPHGL